MSKGQLEGGEIARGMSVMASLQKKHMEETEKKLKAAHEITDAAIDEYNEALKQEREQEQEMVKKYEEKTGEKLTADKMREMNADVEKHFETADRWTELIENRYSDDPDMRESVEGYFDAFFEEFDKLSEGAQRVAWEQISEGISRDQWPSPEDFIKGYNLPSKLMHRVLDCVEYYASTGGDMNIRRALYRARVKRIEKRESVPKFRQILELMRDPDTPDGLVLKKIREGEFSEADFKKAVEILREEE